MFVYCTVELVVDRMVVYCSVIRVRNAFTVDFVLEDDLDECFDANPTTRVGRSAFR